MVSLITSCTTQFISTVILLISSDVSDHNGLINESIDKGMDEKMAEIIGKERIKMSRTCCKISFNFFFSCGAAAHRAPWSPHS